MINIVIPMAGSGRSFEQAGYMFPKPLIDIKGATMIEVVIGNLRPDCKHRFVFVCRRNHYEKFDLYNIFRRTTNDNFKIVLLEGVTQGAACTVLASIQYINNDDELLIANADQYVDIDINEFLGCARERNADGLIMTFPASHPRWSYARVNKATGKVMETAEKKVISNHATVGLYYFKHGKDFVEAGKEMLYKNIRFNDEFYVCPVYNELILSDKDVSNYEIRSEKVHSLGTPEDLNSFIQMLDSKAVNLNKYE